MPNPIRDYGDPRNPYNGPIEGGSLTDEEAAKVNEARDKMEETMAEKASGHFDPVTPGNLGAHLQDGMDAVRGAPAANTGPGSYSDIIGQLNPYDTAGMEQYMRDRLASLGNRQAPQAGESDFRPDQRALADYLREIVTGNGLTPSQMGLNRDRDAAIAQQRSMAVGGGSPLAARTASQNIGGISGDFAGRSAQAGLADKMAAAGALGGVLQGARGQDQQLAAQNAVMKLQQMGLDDNAISAILGQQLGLAGMQNQFTLGKGQIASGLSLGQSGQDMQKYIADQNSATQKYIAELQALLTREGRPSDFESIMGGIAGMGPLALQIAQMAGLGKGGGGQSGGGINASGIMSGVGSAAGGAIGSYFLPGIGTIAGSWLGGAIGGGLADAGEWMGGAASDIWEGITGWF